MLGNGGYYSWASKLVLSLASLTLASAQAIRMDAISTGMQPLGIGVVYLGGNSQAYVAVANSGENSVSIFRVNRDQQDTDKPKTITLLRSVMGIPSPYAVADCPFDMALVTSPMDDSVRLLRVSTGELAGTMKVGPQPYSVSCFQDQTGRKGVVSNRGNNSLVVFDLATLAITVTIPGVPGSRGLHGIAVDASASGGRVLAWVAGTDANVLTVVDLVSSRVLTQIPVSIPTAVGSGRVASAGANSILFYSSETAQPTTTIQDVPNPQDLALFTGLGSFATIGGQDALWRLDGAGARSIVPGIPGAAALATTSFGFSPNASTSVVFVTSSSSNSVFLIQQAGAYPREFSIANGASFGTSQAAPGVLASSFLQTGASQTFFASSLPVPSSLGGVTLRVGGSLSFSPISGWTYSSTGSLPAPLLFVGPTQVNFQIPPEITVGNSVPMQLTKPDGSTLLGTVNVASTSPGIFTLLQSGQGQGAVLNQDSSRNGDPSFSVGAKHAARGSVIQIFATGAGATNPPVAAGAAAPSNPLAVTVVQPTVTIGGKPAQVQFSGLAPGFVGLCQINAVVPQDVTPGNAVELAISIGGVTSNTVTIAVQ